MISPPGMGAANSEAQSRANIPQLVVFGIIGLVVFFLVRWLIGFTPSGPSPVVETSAAVSTPAPVVSPAFVVVTATPTDTPVPVPTPVVVYEQVIQEVEVTVVSYQYVNLEVEKEVTRIVESIIYPTATPTLGDSQGLVCIYAEGVTGIYVDGVGVPGNQCFSVSFRDPVTDIQLRVTN